MNQHNLKMTHSNFTLTFFRSVLGEEVQSTPKMRTPNLKTRKGPKVAGITFQSVLVDCGQHVISKRMQIKKSLYERQSGNW